MRGSSSCPPDPSQVGPVTGFKELLSYEVAGIRASAALSAIAEICLAVFFNKIGIKNVEQRAGWLVLANPEIAVGFDIKGEGACKAAPIEHLVPKLLFSSSNKEICFYEGRRTDATQIIRVDLICMVRSQFTFADNDGVQPNPGIGIFPCAVINDLVDMVSVSLRDSNVEYQSFSFGKVVIKILNCP